ncbi:helix-turn-helix domain-containing protein [Umezawaea sp. Da 62-37]|uniref:helix-turn-helix domain-containing protein n=1 Tax=Umezawaea sp. Da 62-37 TaxID=3075927 RepID=UPI0028F71947|nr:helix-turn-helix domain-containing protein [Umezawaea sp. Da 62-37]WNV87634.1 helix-turn-helix domain-containing protein [Umezawaea sp. Da 62-37]
MPKVLVARLPIDAAEERAVRKLAGARHAPGDWIRRARIVVASWEGGSTEAVAVQVGCHPQTVREWLHRFNANGVDGLGDRSGAGRRPRLTEDERSRIVAMARTRQPPGRLARQSDGTLDAEVEGAPAHWTLDSLGEALRTEGIAVGRSQVRRILLAEGVRWRRTGSWTTSSDPEFIPKGLGSLGCTSIRRRTRQ